MQQGLQARREGRTQAAHAVFLQVLQAQPEQPDALVLVAELAQGQGDLAAARNLLQRAVRADPQQLVAWSRLASLLEDLGQTSDAEAAWAQSAALKPDFVQAHYNQARLAHALGRRVEAQQALDRALQQPAPAAPLLGQMLQLQALLHDEAGRLPAALQTLDRALQAAPQRAALHHNRGVLLQRLARPAEALAAHDQAMALGLDAADAHYNRGNSLQSLGRSAQALDAYRAALAREPQHALALYDAARLRWRLGDSGFCGELDAAIAAAPDAAGALGIKGRLLLRAERFDEALAAYAAAAERDPAVAAHHGGMGQALASLGRFDAARAAHLQAAALAPHEAAAQINLASCLLQAGQAEAAARAAETALQLNPLDQQAWAVAGLAWRALGDPREAWLNDAVRHIQVFDLPAPEGWPDMASFNQALADALHTLHTDAEAPIDQTLRHGSQTLGDIFDQGHPLVLQLKARIAQAVDRYIASIQGLPADPAHPLRSRATAGWRFTDSWSSRLRSSGYHTHHVHPHGWISSCYYVALPAGIGQGADAGHAGWITFGTPDITVPGCAFPPARAEQPRVGRLVLFPSFMWHGTVPFTDPQPRLTIAFDVVPQP
jgi:tetratricopeptide (TPR) repeat protein